MNGLPTPELFRHYPELRERLAWVPLARATEVQPMSRLASYLQGADVYIKRDDQTSDLFGGIMPRKLEFIFGAILRQGAKRLLGFGCVGGTLNVAISTFARQFDLHAIFALRGLCSITSGDQLQENLKKQLELGSELHRLDAGPQALYRLFKSCTSRTKDDEDQRWPHIIWPRTVEQAAVLGSLNAAFELHRQIEIGLMPRPDRVYIPVDTGCSLIGLAMGFELCGLESRIIGVSVQDGHRTQYRKLFRRCVQALRNHSKQFPAVRFPEERIEIRRDYEQKVHGAAPAAIPLQTRGLLRDLENLELDDRITARSMAALITDHRNGLTNGPSLFWNTVAPHQRNRASSIQLQLPREFQEFFVSGKA